MDGVRWAPDLSGRPLREECKRLTVTLGTCNVMQHRRSAVTEKSTNSKTSFVLELRLLHKIIFGVAKMFLTEDSLLSPALNTFAELEHLLLKRNGRILCVGCKALCGERQFTKT